MAETAEAPVASESGAPESTSQPGGELASIGAILKAKEGAPEPLTGRHRNPNRVPPPPITEAIAAERDEAPKDEEDEAPEPVAKAPEKPAEKAPPPAAEPDNRLLQRLAESLMAAPAEEMNLSRLQAAQRQSRRESQLAQEIADLRKQIESGTQPQRQAEPEPEEAEPDWFEDPKGAMKRQLTPLEEQNRQLQERLDRLENERSIERFRNEENRFAAENSGYFETVSRYRNEKFNRWVKLGASEEQAVNLVAREDQGVILLAGETGIPPWVLMHDNAVTNLKGWGLLPSEATAAPTKPVALPGQVPVAPHVRKAPARPDGSIASARAAMASPAAGTLTSESGDEAGGELTPEALLESGVDDSTVARLFAQGGKRGYFDLMRKVEKAAAASRRR